ncbi:alpha/beta hydrolase [Streptomyces tremellae]|uniref:Alpha/beta hydrolase n=1 Tax=Streptomyces tremellae TaxID=1124239 RepID=A0ABP7GC23_9ACTN
MLIDGTAFEEGLADVNGTRLHYVTGGSGTPLLLLPGWPRTWWQFHKVLPRLARRYRVIAVDLRGMGDSAKPVGGYDKQTMARDVHELLTALGHRAALVAGDDIGAMVAHAFAAHHPEAARKVVLCEGVHPGPYVDAMPLVPRPGGPSSWWFALHQPDGLPEQLLAGRYRLVIEHVTRQLARFPEAIDAESLDRYAAAYEQPGAARAAAGWYRTVREDMAQAARFPAIRMPVLALASAGNAAAVAGALAATVPDARHHEVADTGHYVAEENPDGYADALISFFG